jgi:hypothetical protein
MRKKEVKPKATNPIIPIDILLEECKKAVVHEVARDFHAEAKEIISLGTDDDRREFLKYYKEDKGNICCLVLDRIKRDLVAEGKMKHNDDDAFGKPFML